jgi:tetratricopeptide (TPR) repeat protein
LPDHPSHQELAAFLAASRSGSTGRSRIVRHLLAGCEVCRRRLQAIDPGHPLARPLGRRRPPADRGGSPSPDYSAAFDNAERTLDFFLDQGQPVESPPGELLAELGMPAVEWAGIAGHRAARHAIPFFTRWLVEQSHRLRYSNPEQMLDCALVGRLAAEGCSPQAVGSQAKRADLRASAEAQLSTALRVLGRVEEAEECMRSAWTHLERGTGDPEIRATVLDKTTSLLTLQKDFQLAIDLSIEVSATFASLGMWHRSAVAKVTGAIAMLYSGRPEHASRALRQALPEIDAREDPTILHITRHNLVRCYFDLGETERALATYQGWPRIPLRLEPLIQLRTDWQQALLLAALGERLSAVRILDQVRRGYVERRLAREVIVVTGDLARTLEEMGERERASYLLEDTADWIEHGSFGPEMTRFFAELRTGNPPAPAGT